VSVEITCVTRSRSREVTAHYHVSELHASCGCFAANPEATASRSVTAATSFCMPQPVARGGSRQKKVSTAAVMDRKSESQAEHELEFCVWRVARAVSVFERPARHSGNYRVTTGEHWPFAVFYWGRWSSLMTQQACCQIRLGCLHISSRARVEMSLFTWN
jgi:hypothetical protein